MAVIKVDASGRREISLCSHRRWIGQLTPQSTLWVPVKQVQSLVHIADVTCSWYPGSGETDPHRTGNISNGNIKYIVLISKEMAVQYVLLQVPYPA